MKKEIKDALSLPTVRLNSIATPIRMEMINEAICWSAGPSIEEQHHHPIWNNDEYHVVLAKPGKEKFLETVRHKDGHRDNNENDMRPTIIEYGSRIDDVGTFEAIFEEFQILGRSDEEALELLACLLFRNAFMLDHKQVNGFYRYRPPLLIINEISSRIGMMYKVPVLVFLQFLEALAWNEDVKYHTIGHDIKTGIGRQNNLLTCVNIIGVMLNKVSLVKFAGAFARPPAGISAISQKKAKEIFPYLTPIIES